MLLEQKTMLESKLEAASRSQPQSSGGSSSSSSTSSSNNATAGASSEGLAQEVEQLRTRLAAETTRAQRALTDLATTKAEVGRLRSVISREVGEQVSEGKCCHSRKRDYVAFVANMPQVSSVNSFILSTIIQFPSHPALFSAPSRC